MLPQRNQKQIEVHLVCEKYWFSHMFLKIVSLVLIIFCGMQVTSPIWVHSLWSFYHQGHLDHDSVLV